MEKSKTDFTSESFVSSTRAVIFDVDGTLYDQGKLRQRIWWEIIRFLVACPTGLRDLKILWDFRKARNKNASWIEGDIERRQFEWGAKASKVSVEKVRQVVQYWMFTLPLFHLAACCYPGMRELFSRIKEKGILIGAFSDYPAKDKLKALGLEVDVMVSAMDVDVDRLKPNPEGLIIAAAKLNTPVKGCLFIGDRDDKDGECARRAGMAYLVLNRSRRNSLRNGFKTYAEIMSRILAG